MDLNSSFVILAFGFVFAICLTFGLRLKFSSDLSLAGDEKSDNSSSELSPVELAYLVRPGDAVHSLIVLSVDLIQKGVKRPDSVEAELKLAPFEAEVWTSVKSYLKEWSEGKAVELLPELRRSSPVHVALGLWKVREVIFDALKSTLSDLVKDPLSIRKYFSPTGLLRFVVSMVSSSVKDNLRRGLESRLLERGLLVSEASRQKIFQKLMFLFWGNVIFVVLLAVIVLRTHELVLVGLLAVASVVNGLVICAGAVLRGLVPLYEEFDTVLSSIKRTSLRLALVRGVVSAVRYGTSIACIGVVIALFILESALANMLAGSCVPGVDWRVCPFILFLLTVNSQIVVSIFMRSLQISLNHCLTGKAEILVRRQRKKLHTQSPVRAFADALNKPEYDDTLSYIVAMYGVETLWLLA